MAKLNIEEVIEQLEPEFRKAMEATLREHFSDQDYKSRVVFKTFAKEIKKKCKVWISVPNKYIRSE